MDFRSNIILFFLACLFITGTAAAQTYGARQDTQNNSNQVAVYITDASGQPMEGVKVYLRFKAAPLTVLKMDETDEGGVAQFMMTDGNGTLKIWKDDFVPRLFDFYKAGATDLSFKIYRYRSLSDIAHLFENFKECIVHVSESAESGSGNELAGATILYIHESKEPKYAGFYAVEGITDGKGEVVMKVPVKPVYGSIDIWAHKAGYVPQLVPYMCSEDMSSPPKEIFLVPVR